MVLDEFDKLDLRGGRLALPPAGLALEAELPIVEAAQSTNQPKSAQINPGKGSSFW